ncbi:putative chitin deacetylase, partial [Dissophora ornata]
HNLTLTTSTTFTSLVSSSIMVSRSWISLFLTALAVAQVQAASVYPPINKIPPTNSSQVKAWLKDIDLSGAPNITVNTLNGDSNLAGTPPKFVPNCPKNQTDAEITSTCYTACNSNCTADDITTSATPDTFGLTYDSGPSLSTSQLLDNLKKQSLNATFFLLGSNVIQHLDIVKREADDGHHIASNTWSNQPLTTLTNEQIVAEMKWTEKAIQNATGLRPKYMRPPF